MRLLPLVIRAMLQNRNVAQGDPASWPIANDVHPARVIKGPHQGTDDRGRVGTVVTLLVQRSTLAGEPYTRIQNVLENFVMEPIDAEASLIFGTDKEPLTLEEALNAHAERFGDFLSTQAQDAVVASE